MPKKKPDIISLSQYSLLSNFTAADLAGNASSFTFSSSSNLKLWLDITSTISDRSDQSSNISSTEYEHTAPSLPSSNFFTTNLGGNYTFNTAKFDDSENINAKITYSSRTLSPTDGSGNNRSFSISLWFQRNSDHATSSFSVGGLFSLGSASLLEEVQVKINENNGSLTFNIRDTNNGQFFQALCTVATASFHDKFAHLVCTYDHTLGTHVGLKVYINGVDQSATTSAAGTPVVRGDVTTLLIGSIANGSSEFDGNISEVAYFLDKALGASEISAIYNATLYGVAGITTDHNSGILNSPTRLLIRDDDSSSGRYPTIHRMNRFGTDGIKQNIAFDDKHTVRYGTRITDNFDILNIRKKTQRTKAVDEKKWVVSTKDVQLQRENEGALISAFGTTSDDPTAVKNGILMLGGVSDGEGRWVRTKEKVSKPTLIFSLLQGPYNTGADNDFATLRLHQGLPTDTLAVQVSTTGTVGSWKTIPLIKEFISNNASSLLINSSGELVHQPLELIINDVTTSTGVTVGVPGIKLNERRPELKIKIDMHVFSSANYSEPFYIRFIQQSISDTSKIHWALTNVDIISRDQKIRYPFLDETNDVATLFHRSGSIAHPNFPGEIISTGSSISGISDTRSLPFEEQKHVPFKDDQVLVVTPDSFFGPVTSPQIVPGFGSNLLTKTKFEYDLSTTEQTTIGVVTPMPVGNADEFSPPADIPQPMMCYWNDQLKRWETIGSIRPNVKAGFNENSAREVVTSSMVGFSNFGVCARGTGNDTSNDPTLTLFDQNAISAQNRVTDVFGFPFSGRYFASSSQVVKASSLGITKPFLLEALRIDYQAMHGTPLANGFFMTNNDSNANNNAETSISNAINQKVNNFFILRQGKNNYNVRIKVTGSADEFEYSEQIPGFYDLDIDGVAETYVDSVRDLVTYAQNVFVHSNSAGLDRSAGNITFQNMLDALSDRDSVIVLPGESKTNYTGSYSINARTRVTPPLPGVSNVSIGFVTSSTASDITTNAILLEKTRIGRSNGIITNDSRALTNNYSAFKRSDEKIRTDFPLQSGSPQGFRSKTVLLPEADNIDLRSPYIIFPEDDLVFGWGFSLPNYNLSFQSFLLRSGYSNQFKLFGNSKLTLFGSQIKDLEEFHEGLNQNLTTNAVHEVIGSEPVIDQYQIATRGEMTGSMSDRFPYASFFRPVETGPAQVAYVIGRIIVPTRNLPTLPDGAFSYQALWIKGNLPIARVSAEWNVANDNTTFSIIAGTSGNAARDLLINVFEDVVYSGAPASAMRGLDKPVVGKILHQIQPFSAAHEIGRTYQDATIDNLSKNETDGSAQNFGYFLLANPNYAVRLGGSPKHYFNSKRYGMFSDYVKQGHDSRFLRIPGGLGANLAAATNGPVSIRFVEQTVISDGTEITGSQQSNKVFKLISAGDVNGTKASKFQSSNISLAATSSIPFKEDTISNRTYA
tara:strand:- start:27410 stop:31753 length:4344 start_codon:yes stop_codon:yes gene_type:complete